MRICFVGDSFVLGTGDPTLLGWPGRICMAAAGRGHDMTCYNLGIRGNTSADILRRWREETRARSVAGQDCRLVFSFGVNDTKDDAAGKRIIAAAESLANAREILSAAVASQPALMVGPAPVTSAERNKRASELCKSYSKLCGELGVPYLPVMEDLRDRSPWIEEARGNDGTHPRKAGYDSLAALVEAWSAWRAWVP